MRAVERVMDPILAFCLPGSCFVCKQPLTYRNHLGACIACWADLQRIEESCPGCGLPRPSSTDLLGPARGRCATCLLTPRTLERIDAAVIYDDRARRILLRAKIGMRRELFLPMAAQLAATVRGKGLARGCTAVVPVPSHPWVTWRRGFSPAGELARAVARTTGLPLRAGALRRRISAVRRVKTLGRRRRRAALTDAFRVHGNLVGQRLLLVDDVMTTGATLDSCAQALVAQGATVRGAVWARTGMPN